MPYEHSCVLDTSVSEVFAWHSRPGAIHRLMPPWQPLRVISEAQSLADGRAVLGLPGGFRWVATHQPGLYDPPHRFVDVLTTAVLAPALRWEHTHEFSPEGTDRTLVTDTVSSHLPDRFLRETFAYRCRQLRGDLAAHSRAAGYRLAPMTVAVTGSSGLIGSALCSLLTTGGHRVIRLTRRAGSGPDERQWNPDHPAPDLLRDVDAVVHLAGESIAGRFTPAHKQAIRDSRIEPSRRLAELASSTGVSAFISASAIGFYGADPGDESLTEASPRGDGFLAEVVADWEAASEAARQGGVRVAQVRTGIVQSPRGGVLRLLRPLFEAGLGGRLGDGRQWTSWIGIDDLLDIYLRVLVDPSLEGPINAVSPNPVRNAEYTKTLARVLHRPALVPVPSIGPRLLLGTEGAQEVAQAGQRVRPQRLLDGQHTFRHGDLEDALRHVLGRSGRG
jgi:hypothetical protein